MAIVAVSIEEGIRIFIDNLETQASYNNEIGSTEKIRVLHQLISIIQKTMPCMA